ERKCVHDAAHRSGPGRCLIVVLNQVQAMIAIFAPLLRLQRFPLARSASSCAQWKPRGSWRRLSRRLLERNGFAEPPEQKAKEERLPVRGLPSNRAGTGSTTSVKHWRPPPAKPAGRTACDPPIGQGDVASRITHAPLERPDGLTITRPPQLRP